MNNKFSTFLGTTIDACQQIVNRKENTKHELIGVACISFLTSEFVREDWSNTEDSYWFLIEKNGMKIKLKTVTNYIHTKTNMKFGSYKSNFSLQRK